MHQYIVHSNVGAQLGSLLAASNLEQQTTFESFDASTDDQEILGVNIQISYVPTI